jgi:transposase-like protein
LQGKELQVRRKKQVNKYPTAFRKTALERLKSCRNVTELSAELGIHRTQLYKWRDQMEPIEDGPGPAANSGERELMRMHGSLSVERMCQLARVSRAGFYRSLQEQMPVEEAMEVRSAIQTIALEHRRRYGYRRIMAELRRRGMLVNHKRVARIMREDSLLGIQPRLSW